MYMELEKPDPSKMIWLLFNEDEKTVVSFQGSEQECLDLWDKMSERGIRIIKIEHQPVWTKDRNPFLDY